MTRVTQPRPCHALHTLHTCQVWVGSPAVRSALHVPADAFFYDSDGGGPYHGSEKNLMPFYQHVAKNTELRVLIYNGCVAPTRARRHGRVTHVTTV